MADVLVPAAAVAGGAPPPPPSPPPPGWEVVGQFMQYSVTEIGRHVCTFIVGAQKVCASSGGMKDLLQLISSVCRVFENIKNSAVFEQFVEKNQPIAEICFCYKDCR